MPFDDFIDIRDNDLTISDLEKLDKAAEKAEKRLEKLKRKGGAFAESRQGKTFPKSLPSSSQAPVSIDPTVLSKKDKKFQKKIERLTKKIEKDTVKQFGKNKKSVLSDVFGENIGQNIFQFGKDPAGFLKGAALGLGAFAGAGFAIEIAQTVINEIIRIDRFFKVFIDRVDTRFNQLRGQEQQARTAAGLQQIITTTRAGNTEARDSYNTFTEFNTNRSKLQEDFALRNTSGYD